jgi:WhiB family redox-sensing transcriptional regulator
MSTRRLSASTPWQGSGHAGGFALAGPPAWMLRGACTREDPEVFFSDDIADEVQATAICAGCPVMDRCLEWALTRPEPHGTWGGLTSAERAGGVKRCSQCHEVKPLDQFPQQATKKPGRGRVITTKRDGRHCYCRECYNTRRAERRRAVGGGQQRRRVTVSQLAEIRARRETGETIVSIAADLGFSDPYLSQLLSGSRQPAPDIEEDAA